VARTFSYQKTNARKKETKKTADPPKGTPLLDYQDFQPDPLKNLIGKRFLCIEGSFLLVGPSGIGKSSATIQLSILFSAGVPAFNLSPTRPLSISIIQAEDDEGDIAEMVSGAAGHFKLSPEQIILSKKNCRIYFHRELTAEQFLLDLVAPILAQDRPDLVIINPLQAYLGADAKDVEKVSRFLRNGLNPLLKEYQCAAILVHHTPKTNFRTTDKWRANDWAYAGAGAADITNFARGIIIIEPTNIDKISLLSKIIVSWTR
jgi:RecA-family ATPase